MGLLTANAAAVSWCVRSGPGSIGLSVLSISLSIFFLGFSFRCVRPLVLPAPTSQRTLLLHSNHFQTLNFLKPRKLSQYCLTDLLLCLSNLGIPHKIVPPQPCPVLFQVAVPGAGKSEHPLYHSPAGGGGSVVSLPGVCLRQGMHEGTLPLYINGDVACDLQNLFLC